MFRGIVEKFSKHFIISLCCKLIFGVKWNFFIDIFIDMLRKRLWEIEVPMSLRVFNGSFLTLFGNYCVEFF